MLKNLENIIDTQMPSIIELVKDIGAHPELGYKEFRTSALVNDYLKYVGYVTESNLAVTGIKTSLKIEDTSPNIAFIGELDGITCAESLKADRATGATHNCGHHIQLGVMLAVAYAFKTSGISPHLGGNITFIAAPAEEYIELDYRTELKREGKISYFGGKQELVKRGAFDNIDAAMMVHSRSNQKHPFVGIAQSSNGFIAEKIRYTGKTAHAAAAPEKGINALHAAVLGINNINALRETFCDDNHNRIHYIITKGGDVVNSIPSDACLECFVRSNSVVSIEEQLEKTNRAFISGGDALNAKTTINQLSGYLPLVCNAQLNEIFAKNAKRYMQANQIVNLAHSNASTDMGDISHIMPAIHPYVGGVSGTIHAADFEVTDYYAAVAIPAKIISSTLIELLSNNAAKMKSILNIYKPVFSKNEYLNWLDMHFV